MAQEDNGHNKTEPGSPRKREEARKKGIFAHSNDLSAVLILVAGLLALAAFGPGMNNALVAFMHGWLAHLDGHRPLAAVLSGPAVNNFYPVGSAALMLIGVVTLAAIATSVMQAGIHVYPELLSPQWERIYPSAGVSRLFSLSALANALFGILKL